MDKLSYRSGRVVSAGILAAVTAGSILAAPAATAAEVAKPEGYQVKLRLEDSVLDGSGNLTAEAANFFAIPDAAGKAEAPETEQSVYVDSSDSALGSKGWTARLRHKSGDDEYDLTYKYRQDLSDNTLSEDSIDEALEKAKDADFDSSDDNYEPQVNASYSTSTLDFSNKKSAECEADDCAIPAPAKAVELLDDELPGKLEEQTGGTLADAGATASQVVTQRTWPVTVDGTEAELEVTAMSGGYFVEITGEFDKRGDAADSRSALIETLDSEGILRHGDAFKTQLVLDGTL